jgi:hypothetical protein
VPAAGSWQYSHLYIRAVQQGSTAAVQQQYSKAAECHAVSDAAGGNREDELEAAYNASKSARPDMIVNTQPNFTANSACPEALHCSRCANRAAAVALQSRPKLLSVHPHVTNR